MTGIPARRIRLKRAYASPARGDGLRILVGRLWPRGLTKESAALDRWCKELAPSTGLRRWFSHDPARWPEFRRRYAAELQAQRAGLGALRTLAREQPITLLYGARDPARNNAVVLRAKLLGR